MNYSELIARLDIGSNIKYVIIYFPHNQTYKCRHLVKKEYPYRWHLEFDSKPYSTYKSVMIYLCSIIEEESRKGK